LTTFAELGLAPELLQAVAEQGYTEPTPIQAQAIPLVLAGKDVMGAAQTGTGKTAGFTLPTLQRLLQYASTSTSPARHPVRALVLAPTRELAVQVEESVRTYSKYVAIKSTCIYGGVNMDAQIQELRRGVEIVVATPGRLLDHVQQRTINLQQVEVFVLDEADRMLDMGFIPDVRRILALLPGRKQSLLFSATIGEEIRKLADSFLKDPVLVQVARKNQAAELVTHLVHPVAREKKRELLVHLIKTRGIRQVLVFCGTRLGTNRLAYQLTREGVHAAAIHGDKTQGERTQALEEFKAGKVGILVATDVAARGLDIEELPFVVNFDLPNTPEDYVHRIGRTGRAGLSGEAISLVSPEEHEKLAEIEKMIKIRIRREIVPGFGPRAADAPPLMEPPRREKRRDADEDRLTRSRPSIRQSAERAKAPAADPIFSKPYEPSKRPAAAKPEATQRPQRQVAALLGGFVRKSS
jgi:ATP-dependent RNA helicase RhlE